MPARLSYIDTARFIAIFLIMVGHASMHGSLTPLLYSFHVQLFFVIYGFTSSIDNSTISPYRDKVLRQVHRLIIPYIILSFLLGSPLSLKNLCFVLYGGYSGTGHPSALHLWFLPCFFLSSIIFEKLIRLEGNRIMRVVIIPLVLVLFAFIASYLDYDNDIQFSIRDTIFHLNGIDWSFNNKKEYYIGFPFNANVALTGVILMYAGRYARLFVSRSFSKIAHWGGRFIVLLAFSLIFAVLGYVAFHYNQGNVSSNFKYDMVAMSLSVYGNYVLFLCSSIFFSFSILLLSKIVDNKLFSRYGKLTMEIYGFHMVFMSLCISIINKLGIPYLSGIPVALLCLIINCMVIPYIDMIFPFFSPKKKAE